MVNGPRIGTTAALTALLLATAACGGDARAHRAAASSTAATSSQPPTPEASASQTPGGVSAAHPARLYLVPADGAGTSCPRPHPLGAICDAQHNAYRYDPAALRTLRVLRALVTQDEGGQWAVEIDADAAGTKALTQVTRQAAKAREYVLLMTSQSGPVITAPQVQQPIRGGKLQIAGLGDRAAAAAIVNQITRTAG